jgi:Uma2 family endonuclease
MAALPLQRDIDYPESDGRPLGETDRHRQEIVDLVFALDQRYKDAPDIYVSGNLLLYSDREDVRKVVSPDVFLVEGVAKETRPIYKLWEEERAPSLVIEVTSKSTWTEDLVEKKGKYTRLGVAEYFLFDPLNEYLRPRLQGFRLVRGRYLPIQPFADGSLPSAVTGLRLQMEGDRLRLVDLATGEKLLWTVEEKAAREAAEAQSAVDRAAREAAEMQSAVDRAAREAAEMQSAVDRAARKAAEEEVARLRRELAERDRGD